MNLAPSQGFTPRRNPLNIDETANDTPEQLAYTGGDKIVDHPRSSRKFTKIELLGKPVNVSTEDWKPSDEISHENLRNQQRHENLPKQQQNRIFPNAEGEFVVDTTGLGVGGGARKHFEEPAEEKWMHTEDAVAGEDTYRWTRKPLPAPCPPRLQEDVPHIGRKLIPSNVRATLQTECTEETPEEFGGSIRSLERYKNCRRILPEPNFVTPSDVSNYSDKEFHDRPVQFGKAGRYEHTPLPSLETLQGVLKPCDDGRLRKPVPPAPFGLETDSQN
mmetsp:Transcript_11182/g.16905  ORF Transcript_11182/g.16905 Transcript_11182/m.16905 type:complete len:275 (-) Transcript_11182:48-872(-)